MSTTAVLNELAYLGVECRVVGENLRLKPADKVTPDLVAALKMHKLAIINMLTEPLADLRAGASAAGYQPPDRLIMEGWSSNSWKQNLIRLADLCRELVPDRSAWLRAWAESIEAEE